MKIWAVKKEGNKLFGGCFRYRGDSVFLENELSEIFPKNLKGKKICLIFEPQDFYFSREIFPKTDHEILKLQIQEKLHELGLFETPPLIRYQIGEDLGNQVEVEIAALENKEISNLIRFSTEIESRLEKIVPEELAIAYLTLQETPKFILSIYISKNKFLIFLTGQGNIYYFRNIDIDPDFGITENILEEGLLASMDYCERIIGIEIEGILTYGPQRDILKENTINLYKPKFSFIKGTKIDKILEFPSLFGSIFIPDSFNFIPLNQLIFLKNLSRARYISYIFIILAIINYGLWGIYEPKTSKLEREIKIIENEIKKKNEILQKLLPEEKRRIIEKRNLLINNYKKEFKLNNFLYYIENILPSKAEIIEAKGEKKEDSFLFELKAKFEGELKVVEKEINTFYKKLANLYNLEERIFSYEPKKKEGILLIKGRK